MAVRDSGYLLFGLVVLFHTWGALAVEVNMEDRVEVFIDDMAQLTCKFTSEEGIGGMMIQWFYMTPAGEKQKIYYQDSTMKVVDRGTPFTDRISVNGTGAEGEVVLTIRDVQQRDEVEFICLVKSLTDGIAEGRTKLKVFALPDSPTIEGVQTGISINEASPPKIGICEVKNGFPRPNITWYKNNTPLHNIPGEVRLVPSTTSESSGLYSVTSELYMKLVKEDKDNYFYCEVTYFVPGAKMMVETNRINVTVLYPSTAVKVWVESPKGEIKEGDTVEIHCSGNGNTAAEIKITHRDNETSTEDGVLVMKSVTRAHSGVYFCSSMDLYTYEEVSGNTTVFVNFLDDAVVEPERIMEVAQGEEVKATCNALSSLQTHTTWLKNGKEVSKGHILTLEATFDTAGTYVCVVSVPEIEGMTTSETLRINVQGPPEILEPVSTEIEESFDSTVDLSCDVRGFPAPTIVWSTSDGKILPTTSQEETDEGVHSVVSVRVTSDMIAFCNASNVYGTDAMAFSIKAIKHTTTPATTTTTVSTVKADTAIPAKTVPKEGKGVIIAVIIICILLLAVLGSVLYFLYKKGKICGRSGKQDLTKEKSNKDNIVVEMKSDNTEEAVLLGVNGEKLPPSDQ
ncbi:melanoma cell adhesion molecule b isoform X1 [Sphaeramia orbicularis]|uniref:melanoma cell adhesion molecule b isoform X1 n=1 Tax=Sphaeramia orbicularis TaxID=375764 RepID=UPI00117F9657|nr:cell surface glycoprotein MUC18 isoform X1 [Sphaeramia orbicularis]